MGMTKEQQERKERFEQKKEQEKAEQNAYLQKMGSSIIKQLDLMAPKFAASLPPHIPVQRFIRACVVAITQDPKILVCTPKSILEACSTSAILGLEPNKHLGEAYFVPFNDNKEGVKKCQFITGYKGFLKLARNSGEVSLIYAEVVYDGDEFEYQLGLEPKLEHKPTARDRSDAAITHAYSVVKYKDESFAFRVLTRLEIEKRRRESRSQDGDASPWVKWYPEQCRKTAIRALSNQLPKSVQQANVLQGTVDRGGYAALDSDNAAFLLDLPEANEDNDDQVSGALPEKATSRMDALADQFSDNSGQSEMSPPYVDPATGEVIDIGQLQDNPQ